MGKIKIQVMTESAFRTLSENIDTCTKYFNAHPNSSKWIEKIVDEEIFQEERYEIEDFKLTIPKDANDMQTIAKNAKLMYEKLHHLPRYIVSSRYFWAWFTFERAYGVALHMMDEKVSKRFRNQWLSSAEDRRVITRGVLARWFHVVDLLMGSGPSALELVDYALEKPMRYLPFLDRNISSAKHISRGLVGGEKIVNDQYGVLDGGTYYGELFIELSKLGSIQAIDMMTEEDIKKFTITAYTDILKKWHKI